MDRALKREKTKRRRFFGVPAVSFAACFLGFVLLVNAFPPLAKACEEIPILRDLAKVVGYAIDWAVQDLEIEEITALLS